MTEYRELEYAGEAWEYRVPKPLAAMFLGAASRKSAKAGRKIDAIMGYLEHVLSSKSVDRMMERAQDHEDEFDTEHMAELVKLISQEGSARPYWVDSALSGVAVRQWPTIRGHLVAYGIADPLRQLPTLYALLDAVERMMLESMEKEADREMYFIRTYAPPSGTSMTASTLPKGWSREDELEAFRAARD